MTSNQIITKLLKIRGLTTKKAIDEFFNPTRPEDIQSPFDSKPAIRLIKSHIKKGHKIAIYGDYDVDGICSTAILWETLYANYKNVFPHIPHRESEGYGLSTKGIDHCLSQEAKLIITVDNGIVAHEQVEYARDKNCDVIIIDHHESDGQLPNANCILHSTSCSAAGLAWFFCRDYLLSMNHEPTNHEHLSLVSVSTICDIVPLLGISRSFVKYGMEELNHTTRPGLLALFKEAGLPANQLTPYHVGFVIGPRLNATGRLEHAIDSLRLLCIHNANQATKLAKQLNDINNLRQDTTKNSVELALQSITMTDVLVTASGEYHEGIIGLVAAKLVEKYQHPAIVISKRELLSKGSARSISGFHITDHLRKFTKLLTAVGGHSMAAGFSIETSKLEEFISRVSQADIDPKLFIKTQRVDLDIPLSAVNYELFNKLSKFKPFGMGNPQPVFRSKAVTPIDIKKIGSLGNHLKFKVGDIDCVWFNAGEITQKTGDLVYAIDENHYNGTTSLQLVVKDIQ